MDPLAILEKREKDDFDLNEVSSKKNKKNKEKEMEIIDEITEDDPYSDEEEMEADEDDGSPRQKKMNAGDDGHQTTSKMKSLISEEDREDTVEKHMFHAKQVNCKDLTKYV